MNTTLKKKKFSLINQDVMRVALLVLFLCAVDAKVVLRVQDLGESGCALDHTLTRLATTEEKGHNVVLVDTASSSVMVHFEYDCEGICRAWGGGHSCEGFCSTHYFYHSDACVESKILDMVARATRELQATPRTFLEAVEHFVVPMMDDMQMECRQVGQHLPISDKFVIAPENDLSLNTFVDWIGWPAMILTVALWLSFFYLLVREPMVQPGN